jgi:hypothetical protein
MVDIDPGLLQIWISNEHSSIVPYDIYLTIGETVGLQGGNIPDLGVAWVYTPPCVALDWWPRVQAADEAPLTTVAHWYANAGIDSDPGSDDKRAGFLPFLELPALITQPLELALDVEPDNEECVKLKQKGWRVRNAHSIGATPLHYQNYIQSSFGEFSCAKPAYLNLQTAWISDRTICYLASGKPAVVQHTGPSRFLPDAAGLFRFRNKAEAVRYIELVVQDYDHQCRLARELAEEYFSAKKVLARVLERALA